MREWACCCIAKELQKALYLPTKRSGLNLYLQSAMGVYFLHNYILFFYSATADKAYRPQTCNKKISLYRSSHLTKQSCMHFSGATIAAEECLLARPGSGQEKGRGKFFIQRATPQNIERRYLIFSVIIKKKAHIFVCIKPTGHLLKEAPPCFISCVVDGWMGEG